MRTSKYLVLQEILVQTSGGARIYKTGYRRLTYTSASDTILSEFLKLE